MTIMPVAPRYFQLLDYEPGALEPTFQRFREHLHPDDRERVVQAIWAHLEQRRSYCLEFRLRTSREEAARLAGEWRRMGRQRHP